MTRIFRGGVPILEGAERWWGCASCGARAVHPANETRTPAHPCPKLGGLHVSFVPVADPDDRIDARHIVVPREDGGVSQIVTEHGDGHTDVDVYVQTGIAQSKGLMG